MHPILFEWGPIRIGSYGVLLACAFLGAIFFTNREFRKHGEDLNLAWDIYLLAIFGGLAGSRGLYIIENWDRFVQHPGSVAFSGTGFSVIGGFLLSFALCFWRLRAAGAPFLRMADLCVPGMATGYAVGRLGCIAAGDGCYGVPTLGPFGMCFPHGLVPTLSSTNLLLVERFHKLFPGIPMPADIPVHPTPLYESFSAFTLLALLLIIPWKIGPGRRFSFFLFWFGGSRFIVEFWRLNPIGPLGLTSDQWLSVGLFLGGAFFFWYSGRAESLAAPVIPETSTIPLPPDESHSLPPDSPNPPSEPPATPPASNG